MDSTCEINRLWNGIICGVSRISIFSVTKCRLTGRGTVELTIEKVDGSTFSPEAGGEPRKTARIQVVIDGYSAPLTAGNFAKLVIDEAYNGAKLSSTDQAVILNKGLEMKKGNSVPLEIKPAGQFEPLYRTKLDVQICSDGRELVAACSDASIHVYDLQGNKVSLRIPAHIFWQ